MDLDYVAWVDAWNAAWVVKYEREPIIDLAGKAAFTGEEVARIYRWKYQRLWPEKHVRDLREMPNAQITELTGRAFECQDELGALMIVTLLPSAKAAGASAVLTAHNPERYTVMDERAINSLAALELWDKEKQGKSASCVHWPDYLAACRELAAEAGRTLRENDHALWMANGNPGFPGI